MHRDGSGARDTAGAAIAWHVVVVVDIHGGVSGFASGAGSDAGRCDGKSGLQRSLYRNLDLCRLGRSLWRSLSFISWIGRFGPGAGPKIAPGFMSCSNSGPPTCHSLSGGNRGGVLGVLSPTLPSPDRPCSRPRSATPHQSSKSTTYPLSHEIRCEPVRHSPKTTTQDSRSVERWMSTASSSPAIVVTN